MKVRFFALGLAVSGLMSVASAPANAQSQYVSEVRLFATNFCPVGWMPANGQILPIQQYIPLFSLLGVTYGGDGKTNFALPNLQGRAPTGVSATEPLGTAYGASTVALTQAELPKISPKMNASTAAPSTTSPSGALLGTPTSPQAGYAPPGSPANKLMSVNAIEPLGSGQPVPTQSPSLSMTWCIAYLGVFPPRN
jgi:microcystin-dependent protein